MSDSNKIELAYLAGIFDGEGHICIARHVPSKHNSIKSVNHRLSIGITNTNVPLIKWLKRKYGGCIGRTGIRDGHRIDAYRWRLAGVAVGGFLKMLLPYLRIKRNQALIGIKFRKMMNVRNRGKALTKEEVRARDKCLRDLITSRYK